jgi:hypothetical protein
MIQHISNRTVEDAGHIAFHLVIIFAAISIDIHFMRCGRFHRLAMKRKDGLLVDVATASGR